MWHLICLCPRSVWNWRNENRINGKKVTADIENKKINESAPFPFSLDTLQKAANETFGMTASDTLAAAQKVYEGYGSGGSLSYPRTDASHYTEDMKAEIPKYIKNLAGLPAYRPFVEKLNGNINIPKNELLGTKYEYLIPYID